METIEITTEQIAQHYKAMGDSVTLINQLLDNPPEMMSEQEVADTIKRNVDHLEIMLAKDFWTDEDMSDVEAAIAAGK
jgi:dihydrodipicolinate synthase/N-acetylneuraminate lyase